MHDAELIWRTKPRESWTFALLLPSLDQLGITVHGVIHVGAHHAEELPYYRAAQAEYVLLIEPDPDCCEFIAARPDVGAAQGVYLLQGAIAGASGAATYYREQVSVFGGLQARTRDSQPAGEVQVGTSRLDTLQNAVGHVAGQCNVLVVDTQGTELEALQTADLTKLDLVIVEAYGNSQLGRPPRVKCAAEVGALEAYMAASGWRPAIRWVYDGSGYFDQLYVRA